MSDSEEFGTYPDEDLDADNPLLDIVEDIDTSRDTVVAVDPEAADEIFADPNTREEVDQLLRGIKAEDAAIERAKQHYGTSPDAAAASN